jgi:hypothetical protein
MSGYRDGYGRSFATEDSDDCDTRAFFSEA